MIRLCVPSSTRTFHSWSEMAASCTDYHGVSWSDAFLAIPVLISVRGPHASFTLHLPSARLSGCRPRPPCIRISILAALTTHPPDFVSARDEHSERLRTAISNTHLSNFCKARLWVLLSSSRREIDANHSAYRSAPRSERWFSNFGLWNWA